MTAVFGEVNGTGNINFTIQHTDIAKLADGSFVAVYLFVSDDGSMVVPQQKFINKDGSILNTNIALAPKVTLESGYSFSDSGINIEVLDSGRYVITLQSIREIVDRSPIYKNHSLLFAANGVMVHREEPFASQIGLNIETHATDDAGFAVLNFSETGAITFDKMSAFGTKQNELFLGGLDNYTDSTTVALADAKIAVFRQTVSDDAKISLHIVDTKFSATLNIPTAEVTLDNTANNLTAFALDNGNILLAYHDETGIKSRIYDAQTLSFGPETAVKNATYFRSFLSDIEFTQLSDDTVLMHVATRPGIPLDETFVQKFSSDDGTKIGQPIPITTEAFSNSQYNEPTTATIIGTDDGGFLIAGSGSSTSGPDERPGFSVTTYWQGTSADDIELMHEAGSFDAQDGNDFVQGTDGDDIIIGGSGADILNGAGGNDTLYADIINEYAFGSFFDRLSGGDGDDVLINVSGDSHMSGGEGNDTIKGGDALDTAYGGAGNDLISTGFGNDKVYAGGGQDLVFGGMGDDILEAGVGKDVMFGGGGVDLLVGDGGRDRLFGGQGNDIINGGGGIDIIRGGDGSDIMTGGTGADRFVFIGDGPDPLQSFSNEFDIITDFTLGEDRIFLKGLTTASGFGDLEIEAEGAGAVIFVGGREIQVNGIDGALSADDFVFS